MFYNKVTHNHLPSLEVAMSRKFGHCKWFRPIQFNSVKNENNCQIKQDDLYSELISLKHWYD